MNLLCAFKSRLYCLRLITRHYRILPDKSHFSRRCILRIDGRIPNGGLCDRLRGIAAIWLQCKLRDQPFGLVFDHPFDLESVLQPNRYDWRVTDAETGSSIWNVSVRVLFGGGICTGFLTAGRYTYIISEGLI